MAEAAPRRYDIKDLTQCGICLLVLEQPKALPCLHSFCLKCLSQWAKGKTYVTCPLCVQEFEIPSGGVSSFRTNFFINTLKEREENAITIQSKDRIAPCACCELLESKIEGHCAECKGFICADIKHLNNHKIISYADLQSGKVNIKTLHKKNHCKIHEEQVLRFYCETCEGLICRDCTVVDHPATSHILVNLDSATKGQKTEIEQLTKNCNDVRKKIDGSLSDLDTLSEMLVQNATKAEEDIDEAFHNAVKMLESNRNKLKSEVKMIVSEKNKQINADKDTIQLQQTRLVTALHMATEVVQTGSDYDLTLVYSSLKTNLETLRDLKPTHIDKRISDVSFKPTPTSQHVVCNLGSISSSSIRHVKKGIEPASTSQHVTSNIGSISSSSRHVRKGVGVWKMVKSFGNTGNGKLSYGRDIAITQQSEIVVTDYSDKSIKLYETNGHLKSTTYIEDPWCIKVSLDGRVFVTNRTQHVSVYDEEITLKQRFASKSPDGVSSDSQHTALHSLAFDNHNMLLVGECNQKYISKHRLDGTHVMSFKVTIRPEYIAVSSKDKVIVSSFNDYKVHILDKHGNHLHSVKRQPGISLWYPYGVCCTSDDEVYIANWASPGSIDIYSTESGGYIGCLTKDATYPTSLALMDVYDEHKLVVLEQNRVKIFKQE